jgi:hypothetical protein
VLRREFVEVKTFKYDYKGRIVKQTKHIAEAIDDGTDEVPDGEEENAIGFKYEPVDEEDDN